MGLGESPGGRGRIRGPEALRLPCAAVSPAGWGRLGVYGSFEDGLQGQCVQCGQGYVLARVNVGLLGARVTV